MQKTERCSPTEIRNLDLREYRPVPLWSWNDKLEPEELKLQIRQMKQAGFGGFFMHARAGLRTEYLGKEWMEAVQVCVEEAKRLHMRPWIYDENGWPSGFCGMKLLEEPANLAHFLSIREGKEPDAQALASYSLQEDTLVRIQPGETLAPGQTVYNLYDCVSPSFVDVLNPEVVRKFIQSTHEKYAELLGEELGSVVPGFFTDEPQYYRWDTPYSPVLQKKWRELYGADLLDELGALLLPCRQANVFRFRYWKLMNHQFVTSYAKQIYDWCEAHGCQLTGHTIEERILHMQMWCTAGLMPFYEYQQIPGIDWLGRGTDSPLGPRQVGSVAQQLGKKQVLTETFACAGWDATPRELRWIAEMQCVDGVNLLCHHLVPYSIRGQRKRDYPGFFSAHNSWHKDLKIFNDYFAVLGYLLANSKEIAPVGVIHPIRSGYLTYDRRVDGPSMAELEGRFLSLITMLSHKQIGHHYLDETLLERHGRVEGNFLILGQCRYSCIIVPEMDNLSAFTVQLLREFIKNGGKLWLQGKTPFLCDGAPCDLSFLQSNVEEKDLFLDTVRFPEENEYLRSTHRAGAFGEFLYLVNGSQKEVCRTRVIAKCADAQQFDIHTNTMQPVEYSKAGHGELCLSICLAPMESQIIFLRQQSGTPGRQNEPAPAAVSMGKAVLDQATENALTLDTVRLSMDGTNFGPVMPVMALANQLLTQGQNGRIWLRYEFSVQQCPGTLYAEAEHTGYGWTVNGFEVHPEQAGTVDKSFDRREIGVLIHPGKNNLTLSMDYHQSRQVYEVMAMDSEENESLVNCLRYDSDIEAVYLFGKFGVVSEQPYESLPEHVVKNSGPFVLEKMPERINPESITTQGFPFFRGDLRYTQEIETEKTNLRMQLLGRFATARVFVNGNLAAVLALQDTCDISPYLKQGKNQLEIVVTASMRNLLGPHHCAGEPEPLVQCPPTFHMYGTWDGGNSPQYDPAYHFCRFGIKAIFWEKPLA